MLPSPFLSHIVSTHRKKKSDSVRYKPFTALPVSCNGNSTKKLQAHAFIYDFFILQEGMKDTKEMEGQSICYTTEIWAIHTKEVIFSREEATHIHAVSPMQ